MKTTILNGYLFANLCTEVGHKRYQNVFEDVEEGKRYVYETDTPSFADGIRDIDSDSDSNSYTDDCVELSYSGEEPTDADFEKFDEAKSAMHKAAEKAMISAIKERGDVEDL